MTLAEREEIIRQNSIQMNINMDMGWDDDESSFKYVPPIEECEDYIPPETNKESDYPEDEDNEDEYADRYDENENQSDAPNDIDVETYFSSNEKDLSYYTYIRKYKNWIQEIKEYCELFKKKYDIYPNLLIANRITHGRFEDAFNDYYAKDLSEQEILKKRVELGLEYDGSLKDIDEEGIEELGDCGECFFHTEKYKLRMMENTNFGSGVIKLQRVHGFLSHEEEIEYGTVPKGEDKESKAHPVIDIIETGKHLEKIMKEEGVTPKIFARIMGWEKPQAIYRWYYGETLPNIDTLSVLAKILNRPIESLLVMRERDNK